MNASVLYWTGALVNLGVIVSLAAIGIRQIRRGAVAAHRRSMLSAGALVVAFLLSYGVKVVVLGHEDLAIWSAPALRILHLHEFCVSVMLVAGVVALSRAWVFRSSRRVTGNPDDPPARSSAVSLHRRAGWTAVVGALSGFATAVLVLYQMYARL